jgi:hypothetical protein
MKRMISLMTSAALTLTAIPAMVVSAENSEYSRWEKFLKYDLCITNYDELSDDEKELCNFIFDTEQAAGDNIVCERARRTLAGDDVGERITLDQLEDAYGLWASTSFYKSFYGWQTYIDCVPDVICLDYVSEKNSYVFYYNKEYWLDDERSSYVLFREKVTPDSQSHFEVYDGNDKLINTITTKFDCPTRDFRGDTEYMKEFGMIHKNGGWYYTKPDGTAVFAWCDHSLPSSSKKITEPFVIESEINGCPVTAIEKSAFACATLTEIVLPDTIKVIDYRAFINCKYLEKISFPKGLRYIGKLAFYGCDSLANLTLDCPNLTLGENAFYESIGLKTADINAKDIGENAFALCKNLESVTLGNCVESIRYRAFYGDILLTEMALPDSVRTIGQEALDSLTSVTIPSPVEVIGSYPNKTPQEFTSGLTPPPPLRPLKDKPKCAFGENCVIYGHAGTEAESYADEWGLEFVSLDSTSKYTAPTITFEKGDASVKLSWTAVDGAEKYGVVGWINNRWQLIDQCENTSYLLNNLKAGSSYKVAVVTMIGNEWHKDFSNAITVTPLTSAVSKYPNVTNIKFSEKYHQFKLEWNAVDGATQYGIAVKLAGKWKVWTYTDETNFISPKLKAGSTAEMVICAKINGEWDTSNINSRAFEVTVK